MTERELLELLLEKVTGMDTKITNIETEQQSMKKDLRGLKDDLQGVKDEQKSMRVELQGVKDGQQSMTVELQNVKSQLDENTQLTRAIYDRQEVADAKFEALSMDVNELHGKAAYNSEKIDSVAEDQKSTNEILGEHEVSIRTLRRRAV
ncbi:hypothetical protein [Sporosarcina limicola]|uniref:Chromosome segregation ATPase n=1 Tax=Sporosarcina limicola TaxID=34101 RepID=A0A927MKP5_9BACL|nr:hypothetical protein [Sporosarcina limicola]MBE1554917.1 chromosome segregation ATPase [Sporosarcina limicola]